MPQSKNAKMPDFEKSLAELEKIVERMEQGEQTLDDTLKDFERGMALSEKCQKSLDQAQQKVEKLVKKHGSYKLEPLEDDLDGDLEDDLDDE
ncbi:exodeoxyribonuclease VII small subunit [Candidatus Spongiihabitans sp.]|uniref:exodeoxyribonuclease VII small subunit n=1 Tax=Candidatus Spongiihabitans sp. TaxID=3101308 RepID=UPI003C700084